MGSALSRTPGIRKTEEKFQIFYTSAVTKDNPRIQALTAYPSLFTRQKVGWALKQICIQYNHLQRSHSFTLLFTDWSRVLTRQKGRRNLDKTPSVSKKKQINYNQYLHKVLLIYDLLNIAVRAHTAEMWDD
jgi:predicted ABC-type exoprotein transport system permease subunit